MGAGPFFGLSAGDLATLAGGLGLAVLAVLLPDRAAV
jgi:hypothetical protein